MLQSQEAICSRCLTVIDFAIIKQFVISIRERNYYSYLLGIWLQKTYDEQISWLLIFLGRNYFCIYLNLFDVLAVGTDKCVLMFLRT